MERAYSALDASHRDLKESSKKIVKRDKKRDKFFKKLWKGVKGNFKILKPNDRLLPPRLDSDEEEPAIGQLMMLVVMVLSLWKRAAADADLVRPLTFCLYFIDDVVGTLLAFQLGCFSLNLCYFYYFSIFL